MIMEKVLLEAQKEFNEMKGNRKIIVLGTGSISDNVIKVFGIKPNEIELFLESSPKNEMHRSKEVISIKYLNENFEKFTSCLFVYAASEWEAIQKNMRKEVLREITIFNPYVKYSFLITPLYNFANMFKNYLNEYVVGNTKLERTDKKILIMIGERAGSTAPFHAIFLGVLLTKNQYDVEFLFNDLSFFGDYRVGKKSSYYQNIVIGEVLDLVFKKFGIKYFKLSEQPSLNLTKQLSKELHEFEYYNNVWLTRNILFDKDEPMLVKLSKTLRENTLKINGFLNEHKDYYKVYCWTGIHGEWAMLRAIAQSLDIKVFFSEYARGGYSYSLSSPTVMQKDIASIDISSITEQKMLSIKKLGNKHLQRLLKESNSECSLNLISNKKKVLIPLNIFWDSAAFNSDDVFLYFDKWLVETIYHLLNRGDTQVIVRQHPHEKNHVTGKEVKDLLTKKFGDSKDFIFIDKETDFNTYSILNDMDLVLPNTSTVGLEASMLRKPIVVKNDVYYSKLGIGKKANNIKEYFYWIDVILNSNEYHIPEELSGKASFYYALTMLNSIEPFLGHFAKDFSQLLTKEVNEILEHKAVKWLLDLIEYDKFLVINKMEEFEEGE